MKISYSVLSSYNGADLAAIETQIMKALAKYNELNDSYMASVALGSGHARWAKKNRLPAVNQAMAVLDTLNAQKKSMLSDMGQIQGIGLVEQTAAVAGKEPESEIPWSTIGMAVGALVVVVIIVKMI